jgi:hypothetical protein
MAALAFSIALASVPLYAQDKPPAQQQNQQSQDQQQNQQPQAQQQEQQRLSQEEIEQLVAPIALYPDALLAQILTASTYPLEVAMAARWSEKNPKLKGAALEEVMQKQSWDPSVKGLTAVPQVLAMMNDKLDWTEQLGEAFLAQPDDVQNAIQTLRAKAETAGNLKSTKQQRVRKVTATPSPGYVGPPEYIVIEPVEPDVYYVPIYNPVIVFGVDFWPPAFVPFFWYPPWWTVGPAFGFGPAFFVGPAIWCSYHWGYSGFAAVRINTVMYSRFNKVHVGGPGQYHNWKFDPAHHRNVAFKNPKLQQQFGKGGLAGKGRAIKGPIGKGPAFEGKGITGQGPGITGPKIKGPVFDGKGRTIKGPTGAGRVHKGPTGGAGRIHKGTTIKGPSGLSVHRRGPSGIHRGAPSGMRMHRGPSGIHRGAPAGISVHRGPSGIHRGAPSGISVHRGPSGFGGSRPAGGHPSGGRPGGGHPGGKGRH